MAEAPRILLIASWTVFLLVWAVMALRAKPDVVKQTIDERERYSIAFTASLALTVLPLRGPLRPEDGGVAILFSPLFAIGPGLQWTAALIALAGCLLALWARLALGRDWSGMVALKEDHALVTRGPYALVRHPIYTALILLILAAALWVRAGFSFAGLALMILSCWIKLRAEEELLLDYFPDAYSAYMARTRRLVPFLL
jgi:protein-S-isoprenylcysteine O-methyltransferase Ste14